MNDELRRQLRDSNYRLSEVSKQTLKRAIFESVNRMTGSLSDETSCSEPSPAMSSFGTVRPDPPGVGRNGPGEPSIELRTDSELSHDITRDSVDLSLLGPGEISGVANLSAVNAQAQKSQGLSLRSDVVQVPNLGAEYHGSLPEVASPPKSKPLRTVPPSTVSTLSESRPLKENPAISLNGKRNPDSSTTGPDSQKLWHCVCGKKYKTAGGLKYHRAHSVPCNNALSLREAMAAGAAQLERVPIVKGGVSLYPLLDESVSSGITTSAQPGRVDNGEHDIQTFPFDNAYMADVRSNDVRPDNVPLRASDAAVCPQVEAERNASESAASHSLLPSMGRFSPPRSSYASDSSGSRPLGISVGGPSHSDGEGKQITPSIPGRASTNLRETQELFWSKEAEPFSGDSSDEQARTLRDKSHTNRVGRTPRTHLSTMRGEYTKRQNNKGEDSTSGQFQGEDFASDDLAAEQQDRISVSSCAGSDTLPSQLVVFPSKPVTASNNNDIGNSTEVLPHHSKAPAQTLLNRPHPSSQTSQSSIPTTESRRRCKSGTTGNNMAPSLRRRAPVEYYPDLVTESPTSERFDSPGPTTADGLATNQRQQFPNNRTNQSVKKREINVLPPFKVQGTPLQLRISRKANRNAAEKLPYMSFDERIARGIIPGQYLAVGMAEGERYRIVHVDFQEPEYEELIQAVYKIFGPVDPQNVERPARLWLMKLLGNTSEDVRLAIRNCAHQKGSVLERRCGEDIDSFLQDTSQQVLSEIPMELRIYATGYPIQRRSPVPRTTASFLQCRQYGLVGGLCYNVSAKSINRGLRTMLSEQLATWKTWDDASNDVLVVAWSPNGLTYAVGASAQTDPASAQYNKRNNLLLGDLDSNALIELPDHHIDRPRPEGGTSAQWALYNACDPVLQTSVTATRFSVDGKRMYTASYDHTVKVWDISLRGKPFVVSTLKHDAEVELAAISNFHRALLATGSRRREDSIRVYYSADSDDDQGYEARSSSRAKKHTREELYPSSLQWGTTQETSHLLLAGFSAKVKDDTEDVGQTGEVCLWDFNDGRAFKLAPSSQNVFDAVWHPTLPMFATGSTPQLQNRASPTTRSVVRTYEPLRSSLSTVEYECPALDMNDVTFAPHNANYISAGCTDGITYVWDYRVPDKVMLRLQHSNPLAESHPYLTREQHDTGVRFTAWDGEGQYLYTGSSDGFIKQWDIRRAAENVLVRDVAQLKGGVMCGAFSPDYSNLLVGDDTGAIQILSTAPIGQRQYTEAIGCEEGDWVPERIPFQYAPQNQRSTTAPDVLEVDEEDSTSYGTMIANDAVAAGKLSLHPVFGAGKGPNYSGPYCMEARPEGTTEDDVKTIALLPKKQAQQLDRRQRKKARKQGYKAEKAEIEILKEQVKLAWLRNVSVELPDGWGDQYVKERDETLVKQFKEGIDIVQILKELRLQQSGGRDAKVKDLYKGSTSKHAKADEDSDQAVIVRKKSKHRHSVITSDSDDQSITHSTTSVPHYRSVGNIIILDDSDNDEASTTAHLGKYYDPRDAWLPQEQDQILFEDAEVSWFFSREAERAQVLFEAAVEERKRRKEQERKRVQEARVAEERRKLMEARARLLAGK